MTTISQTKRCLAFVAAAVLLTTATTVYAVGELPKIPSESILIETLKTKPAAEKAIACKQLAIVGTKDCVPELAKLLRDEELSSWARIALEAIPDQSADQALVDAAGELKGKLLVGTINSIGAKRIPAGTDVLTKRLKHKNLQVASCAAVALGKIGNEEATKTLRAELKNPASKLRGPVAEGCMLCAERFNKDGKTGEAAAIYDEVRKSEAPKQRKLEATRGYIVAKGSAGIPTLIEQLQSKDKAYFQIGLMTARQLPGRGVTDALTDVLSKLESRRAVGLLNVLADRNDNGLPPIVLQTATSGGDPQLRIAAINAVGRLGDGSCIPMLLEVAADSDQGIADAAASALTTVPGENVNSVLVSNLSKAEGNALAALIRAVGVRRIEATRELMKSLNNSDPAIRHAALAALGATIKQGDLNVLIGQYVKSKNANDADVAAKALRAACIRMADRESVAAALAAAMPGASTAANVKIMEILATMGGPKALETIGAAAKGSDEKLQDEATKALGRWMTVDAAPVLLDLSNSQSGCKYSDRALRGYIRLARQFAMADNERAAICEKALAAASRDQDRKLVLEALERHPSEDGLKIVAKAAKFPGLEDDVRQASVVIAQKVKGDRSAVRQALAEMGVKPVKIEIIKAEYGAGKHTRDVTQILKEDASDYPVISLHATKYNKSFGGDPSPGSVKHLVVEYRIDGKDGKATFAEDDIIMLPTPK
jgi:HEAT repeat protein